MCAMRSMRGGFIGVITQMMFNLSRACDNAEGEMLKYEIVDTMYGSCLVIVLHAGLNHIAYIP
jgi:hypothetical protein